MRVTSSGQVNPAEVKFRPVVANVAKYCTPHWSSWHQPDLRKMRPSSKDSREDVISGIPSDLQDRIHAIYLQFGM